MICLGWHGVDVDLIGTVAGVGDIVVSESLAAVAGDVAVDIKAVGGFNDSRKSRRLIV